MREANTSISILNSIDEACKALEQHCQTRRRFLPVDHRLAEMRSQYMLATYLRDELMKTGSAVFWIAAATATLLGEEIEHLEETTGA